DFRSSSPDRSRIAWRIWDAKCRAFRLSPDRLCADECTVVIVRLDLNRNWHLRTLRPCLRVYRPSARLPPEGVPAVLGRLALVPHLAVRRLLRSCAGRGLP